MKKRYKILIAVLLILLMVFSFLVFKYWRLIRAVWDGFTLSPEKIQSMQVENEKKTAQIVEKLGIQTIKPLTEEEEKELVSGNISKDEAVSIILGNKTMDEIKEEKNPSENTQNESHKEDATQSPSEKPNGNTTLEQATKPQNNTAKSEEQKKIDKANERISNLIGEIYVLKAQFKGELKNVEAWVLQQYSGLSKEDKKQKQSPAEQAIGKQMFARASALESECDSKMKAILSELKTLLEQTGQDVSIVSQIRDAYENEKQITKSYYISTYR